MNASYTLGPPTSTFGPSPRITSVFGVAGLFLCLPAWMVAYGTNERVAWMICFTLAAILVALAVWQLSFRAAVHQSGISCRNIFFSKEWLWNEVDGVYYSAIEVRTRFIPLGEFYRLNLRNVYGQRLSLTNHFDRHEELATTIAQCTFKRLAESALHSFTSGSTVEFGAVTISLADGVTLKRRFFQQKIPWQNIERYGISGSSITFGLHTGLFTEPTISAGRVANLHVLKFLLDHIAKQGTTRA